MVASERNRGALIVMRNPSSCRALLAGFVAAALASPSYAAFDPARFDRIVDKFMAETHAPGVAVGIVKDDKVVYLHGYGVRELGKPGKVDPDTLFSIASCTKPFAAMTAGILVDRGKLQWDDTVVHWLPWFQVADPWITAHMTVRDALAFRTGITSEIPRDVFADRLSYLKSLRTAPGRIPFRAGWAYTNDTMTLTGEVVHTIANESWSDFARDTIWAPLGMTRTDNDYRIASADPNHASPHVWLGDDLALTPIPWLYEDYVALPSGGVNSSVRDMAQWLRLQMSDGTVDGKRIVNASTLREMHTPQTIMRPDSERGEMTPKYVGSDVRNTAWGLAWGIEDYSAGNNQWFTLLKKNGQGDGFSCSSGFVPERRFGVIILNNAGLSALNNVLFYEAVDEELGRPSRPNLDAFVEASVGNALHQMRDVAAAMNAARQPTKPGDASLDPHRYEGRYRGPWGSGVPDTTIMAAPGGAILQWGPREKYRLIPWGPSTMRIVELPYDFADTKGVKLATDAAGRVSGLQYIDLRNGKTHPDEMLKRVAN